MQQTVPMCGPVAPVGELDEATLRRHALSALVKARTALRSGQFAEARLQYDLATKGLPRIADHLALESAKLAIQRGAFSYAKSIYEAASQSPTRDVVVVAREGEVEAAILADDETAPEILQKLLLDFPELSSSDRLLFALSESYERRRLIKDACAIWSRINIEFPGSPYASRAQTHLKRAAASGQPLPQMTDEDRLLRASRLLQRGPLKLANEELQSLLTQIDSFPISLRAKIHRLAADSARREGRWEIAMEHFAAASELLRKEGLTSSQVDTNRRQTFDAAHADDLKYAKDQIESIRGNKALRKLRPNALLEIIRLTSRAQLKPEQTKRSKHSNRSLHEVRARYSRRP
ncbi:MAG: hypothetical protein R3A47_02405 [Polyangiales bacterium]